MPETLTPPVSPTFISYARLRENLRKHPLLATEIPVEDRVSLPLPTRRFTPYGGDAGGAAYAFYAAPAFTLAGRPKTEGAPDFWGAFAARGGGLLVFARCAILPFASAEQSAPWNNVAAPLALNDGQTPESAEDALNRLMQNMETLAPAFFRGEVGDEAARGAALLDFRAAIPVAVHDRYRALAPDFFAWLEAAA